MCIITSGPFDVNCWMKPLKSWWQSILTKYCTNTISYVPFGIAAAPSIFLRTMENILQELSGVCVYLDAWYPDYRQKTKRNTSPICQLCYKNCQQQAWNWNPRNVLFCWKKYNIWDLRFLLRDSNPRWTIMDLLILPMDSRSHFWESWITMANFCQISQCIYVAPFYQLLRKNSHWTWGPEQKEVFQNAK